MTTKCCFCTEICGFKAKGLVTASTILSDIRILAVGRGKRGGREGEGMNAEIYSHWVYSGCESCSYLMQVKIKRGHTLHCFVQRT
jgi:hypothetical protein